MIFKSVPKIMFTGVAKIVKCGLWIMYTEVVVEANVERGSDDNVVGGSGMQSSIRPRLTMLPEVVANMLTEVVNYNVVRGSEIQCCER